MLLRELEAQGIADRAIVELRSRLIERSGAEQSIEANEIQRHLEPILDGLPDDGVGLRAGARVTIADFGTFGHAMLSSHNLRQAHDIILHYRQVLRTVHGVAIEYDNDFFEFLVTDLQVSGRTSRFFTECWLQAHFRCIQLFVDAELPFKCVSLAYDQPPYSEQYTEEFGCPVVFNASKTGYRASIGLLDQTLKFSNEEVRRFCEARCRAILDTMSPSDKTVTQVRTALLSRPGWFPALDEMAIHLGFSARTFRRRMNVEQSSYQAVLDSVRKELAAEYLQSTHLTVEDIAHRLGFVEPNSFYKAFKRWFGTSPRSFQKTL